MITIRMWVLKTGRDPNPGSFILSFFLLRNQIDQASKITNFTADRHHRTIDRQMGNIPTILPTTAHRLTAITMKIDQTAHTNLKSLLITVRRISQTSMNRRRTTITGIIDRTKNRAMNRIARISSWLDRTRMRIDRAPMTDRVVRSKITITRVVQATITRTRMERTRSLTLGAGKASGC